MTLTLQRSRPWPNPFWLPFWLASHATAAAGAALLSFILGGLVYLSLEVEYRRFRDPSGRYGAIVMVPRGALLLPFAPGSGNDSAGSVHLYDAEGNCLGSQRVARVGDVFVEWDSAGRAYVGAQISRSGSRT